MDQQYRPTRRSTDPHRRHHYHNQPRYVNPDYQSPRRHTDPPAPSTGPSLSRVHSRPQDWKNLPQDGKLVQYICFDETEHPRECDEEVVDMAPSLDKKTNTASRDQKQLHHQQRPNSPRAKKDGSPPHDKAPETEVVGAEDEGYESEDELTLPTMLQNDVGHRDDDWCGTRCGRRTASPDQMIEHDLHDHRRDQQEEDKHENQSRAPRASSSSSSSSSSSRRQQQQPSPPLRSEIQPKSNDPHNNSSENLIAQVAHHLQSHRDAYTHRDTKQLVDELLGEVMRKVADGGLDGKTMREVVKEVQHVV